MEKYEIEVSESWRKSGMNFPRILPNIFKDIKSVSVNNCVYFEIGIE